MTPVEPFGGFLRKAREERGLSIADLSRTTKIKESQLERLESSELGSLADVFVVGFIKAYAREVRLDGAEALRRYRAERPRNEPIIDLVVPTEPNAESEPATSLHGRRLGVALVVFLILVVATLTLSLLLRHSAPGAALS